jgi:hypothetical protein
VKFFPAPWNEGGRNETWDWEQFAQTIHEYHPDALKVFATAKILFDLNEAGPGAWKMGKNGEFIIKRGNWKTRSFEHADLGEIARRVCPKLFGEVGKLAFTGDTNNCWSNPFELTWTPGEATVPVAKEIERPKDDIPIATVVKSCVVS